ncbi:MAG: hypothetical protein IT308_10010 [Anaerolineaceae bacterium]|nr:hypothetical protein [Anaerolineaceae bacterium]
MYSLIKKGKTGQGTVEYTLLIALLVLMAIAILSLTGVNLRDIFKNIAAILRTNANTTAAALGNIPAAMEKPPGTQPGKPDIFFEENFTGQKPTRWVTLTSGLWQGQWSFQDGKAYGEPLSAMLIKDFRQSNYLVTVRGVRIHPIKNSYNGFGIFFRTDDWTKGEGYLFEYEKKDAKDPGLFFFSKWVRGCQLFPPMASGPPPAGFDWDLPHDVQVRVEGDTFTAFINSMEVLSGTDSLYPAGSAGVMINNGSAATIDRFEIKQLD